MRGVRLEVSVAGGWPPIGKIRLAAGGADPDQAPMACGRCRGAEARAVRRQGRPWVAWLTIGLAWAAASMSALAQPALAQPALAQPALAQPAPAQPAPAQPARALPAFTPADRPPPPGPPRPLAIDTPVESRLANGLRVIVSRRPGVQLVSAQLLVLAGAEVDPPGRAGAAELTAGLLTQGSRRHSATEMANAAEALGGSLESGAGWNRSSLSITVSTVALDRALGLMREAATEPRFAPAELDRLRSQAIDGMAVAYTRPGTLATLAAERLRFGTGPYGHPQGGTPASLPRITRADLLALHRAHYRPDQAALLLAGDIDTDTAQALAAKHFASWRAAAAEARRAPAERDDDVPVASFESGLPLRTVVIDMPNSGQANVSLFVPVPPRGADRAVADVMNGVLGGGYSSRLNTEIRIRRGLSYHADSRIDSRRAGGLLLASAQTRNDAAAEVAALLQAAFDRLMTEPVADEELAARKSSLIGEFGRGVETTSGLNGVVASLVASDLPLADLGRRIPALSAVTAGEVQRYAAAQLGAGKRRLVIAGEAARFGPALAAALPGGLGPVVTLDPGRLDLEAPAGLGGAR